MRRGVSSGVMRLLALCVLGAALLCPLPASAGSTGWINGTVRGPDGSPLAGIKVQAWFLQVDSEWYTYGAPVTTLANGQYTISGLPGGRTYAVEFRDDSGAYVSEFYNDLQNARAEEASHFPLLADQVIEPVDAALGRAGTIMGTVRNSGGSAVPSVTVQAYQYFGAGSVATTVAASGASKADGTYTLSGLGGGSYVLQFNQSLTQYATHFRSNTPTSGAVKKENATPVSVSVGTTVTGVDETMLRYGRLGGVVYGTGGAPLNAVTADTFRAEGGTWPQQSESALSNPSGEYLTNQQLYPGTYRVRFAAGAPYATQYHLNAIPIEYATDVVISENATTNLVTTLLESDSQAPESTTTPLPVAWVRHDVTASLSATDGAGGSGLGAIYWRLDSSPTSTYSIPVTISDEGTRTLAFWAVDRFGNVESTNTEQVLIDKTPPVTSSDATSTWRSGGVTVSLVTVDPLSGIDRTYVSTDGVSFAEYVTSGVWVADEGTTTIDFYSVDAAENTETVRHAVVRIDDTPPSTGASGFTDGAWRNTTATVSLLPADAGSGIGSTWYSVDGVPASGTAFEVGGEGAHTIEWGSVDAVGNREATRSATINIDATPPSTTASGFTEGAWRNTPATVTLTPGDAGGSGVARTWYSVDGVESSGTVFTVSGSGVHSLEYGSVDTAGNRETTHTGTISIDTTGPTTTASGFTDGAWRNTPATVTLTPGDAGGSGVARTWYSVDGVESSGTVFTVSGAGTHAIEWRSEDAVGNLEASRTATINIDLTPPVTSANAYSGTGAFTLTATDTGGSGLAGTWYSLDGGGWTAGTSISAGAGAHSVRFYSEDNAGNAEAPVGPVAFTVDAPPAPPAPPPSDPPVVVTPTLPKATLTRPYARSYTVYRYRSVPVYGFLKPRHTAGATSVTLQAYHYENGKWVRRATWLAKNSNFYSYTKYSRYIAFKYKGRWRVRAYHSDSRHAPSYSSSSYFTVR